MAHYLSGPYTRRRNKKWISIILGLVIIVMVIVFMFLFPGEKDKEEDKDKATAVAAEPQPKQQEITPVQETDLKPTIEPAAEPVVDNKADLTEEPNSQTAKLIDEAVALLDARPAKIIAARDSLNEALSMPMSRQQRLFVKNKLSELAKIWLFSRTVLPGDNLCSSFKVRSGDLLSTIGKEHNVPYEILMEINGIARPEALQAGQQIKVINGPFHARIYRSTFTMDIYLQSNTFVQSLKVGLGKDATQTPTGLWQIKNKLVEPPWPDPVSGKILHPGDPDYALGSRWIGLDGIDGAAKGRTGFGIHGTKDPETIGTESSLGCIRLHNGDAIHVYNMLVPVLSKVVIVD